jgi:hypothetical protein
MPRAPLRRALFLSILALALASGAASANCGAEGCPLVRDGLGAQVGRFSFDLRYQDVTQDKLWEGSGQITREDAIQQGDLHGDIELLTHSRSWVGEGRMNVTPALQITATLPYVDREHQHWSKHSSGFDPRYMHTWNFHGLADATVLAHLRTLNSARTGTVLTLRGGVKLPTGRTHVPDETQSNPGLPALFDTTLEPSARPGTGSTDWITGAALVQRMPWKNMLPLAASLLYRINTKGTDDFQMGNALELGLSGGYSPIERVTLLGQVNYSSHGDDQSAEASEVAHTGMKAVFLTPGATVEVAPGLALYGLYQARVYGHTKEATVVATNHFIFGTTYSFH